MTTATANVSSTATNQPSRALSIGLFFLGLQKYVDAYDRAVDITKAMVAILAAAGNIWASTREQAHARGFWLARARQRPPRTQSGGCGLAPPGTRESDRVLWQARQVSSRWHDVHSARLARAAAAWRLGPARSTDAQPSGWKARCGSPARKSVAPRIATPLRSWHATQNDWVLWQVPQSGPPRRLSTACIAR